MTDTWYAKMKADPDKYQAYLERKRRNAKNRRPAQNRLYQKRANLKRWYGIDMREYFRLYGTQEGRCKICNNEPPEGKALCVDHCHSAGHVRALLCPNCNFGLGHFRDNPDVLRAAAEYVTDHKDV